jgi:hypothetical protein
VAGEAFAVAVVGEGVSFQEEEEGVVMVIGVVFVGGVVEEGVPGVAEAAMEMTMALGVEVMEAAETTIAVVAEETAMEMITTVVAEILGLQGIAVDRQWGVAGIYPVKLSVNTTNTNLRKKKERVCHETICSPY